jgi:hypothetical protein
MTQQKYLLDLESSPEKQSRAVSNRPIYNEDILALAIHDPSFRKYIRSVVGESDQAHLVIFSTSDACRACLRKTDSLAGKLASALSSSNKNVPVNTLYFTGKFRPAAAGDDAPDRMLFIPPHARADFERKTLASAVAGATAEAWAFMEGVIKPVARLFAAGEQPARSESSTASTLPSTFSWPLL